MPSFINSLSPLALPLTESFACLRIITVENCHSMKKLFPRGLLLQNLEEISVWECDGLEEIISEEISSDYSSHSLTLPKLRNLFLLSCRNMKKLFPRGLLQNLQNLEDISVWECDGLEEIISEEISTDHSSHVVTLPKLRRLTLSDLPSLHSIYSGKLICESLKNLTLGKCGMLKRIPISLPLPSIHFIQVGPREWWEEEAKWDDPDAKQILQPCIQFPDYFSN